MIRSIRRASSDRRWLKVLSTLNEFQARIYVADKAMDWGRGGISYLSKLTGMSRTTITQAVQELESGRRMVTPPEGRVRQPGGGRKRVEEIEPKIRQQLTAIVEHTTAGDPMSLLRWTSKSTRRIAEELTRRGYAISWMTVARYLQQMGYSLQANRKTREGPQHPNRDAQFRYLHRSRGTGGLRRAQTTALGCQHSTRAGEKLLGLGLEQRATVAMIACRSRGVLRQRRGTEWQLSFLFER